MLKTTATESERQLEIIEYNGLPIAAKSISENTDVASLFLPVNVIIYLKRGRLKIYSNKESFYAEPGDCFFVPSYSNYKAQKTLEATSNRFESITFFVDHIVSGTNLNPLDFSVFKNLPSLFKLTSKTVRETFSLLQHQFALKTPFSKNDLERLFHLLEEIAESMGTPVDGSNSNKDNDDFLSFLYDHVGINITLEELALKYGLSTSSFHRLFVKRMGVSPHKWIKEQRLQYARYWMLFSKKRVSEIYLELGFEDISHFSREFKKKFGYCPSRTTKITTTDIIK